VKIEESFVVPAPVDRVWAVFQDVPQLAECLPGAELAGRTESGAYEGKVTAKLGPITASFEGEATVVMDDATHSGTVEGRGVDRRGGSQGRVKMRFTVAEVDEGTRVDVDADVVLSGAAAQFGRTGLIKEMSRRLIDEFVTCLHAKLAAATPEEAAGVTAREVRGLSLFFSSLWASFVRWIRGLARR